MTSTAASASAPVFQMEGVAGKIASSLVIFQDDLGCSCGLVLDAGGLVLCDGRSVVGILPKKIYVLAKEGSRSSVQTIDKYEVRGVLPQLGLALVQLKGVRGQLTPVSISKVEPAPGEKLTQVGLQGGKESPQFDQPVELSQSSVRLEFKKYRVLLARHENVPKYIGGALLDAKGSCLGIMLGNEFQDSYPAFLLADLERKDFMPFDKRPRQGSYIITTNLNDRYHDWYEASTVLLYATDDSGNGEVIQFYTKRGEHQKARLYLRAVVEHDIHCNWAVTRLAKNLLQEGASDEAITLLQRAVWASGSKAPWDEHVRLLSDELVIRGRCAEAAYFQHMLWSRSPDRPPNEDLLSSSHGGALRMLLPFLHYRQVMCLMTPRKDSSPAGLEAFLKLPPPRLSTTMPSFPRSSCVDPTEKGVCLKLDDQVADACLAGHGRYLLLAYKTKNKLDLLDLQINEVVGSIRTLDNQTLFAAGGQVVLTYSPTQNVMEKWNVTRREKLQAKPMTFTGQVKTLAMGLDRDDAALVGHHSYHDGRGWNGWAIICPADLSAMKVESEDDAGIASCDAQLENLAVNCYRSYSGGNDNYANGEVDAFGGLTLRQSFSIRVSGETTVSSDGKTMFVGGRVMRTEQYWPFDQLRPHPQNQPRPRRDTEPDTSPEKSFANSLLLPAYGDSNFYIQIEQPNRLVVRERLNHIMISQMKMPFDLVLPQRGKPIKSSPSRQFWGVARYDKLVLIDPNNPQVFIYRMGVDTEVASRATGPARPGETWVMQMDVPEETKVVIENGPPGMKYDAKLRQLSWAVPADEPPGRKEALVSVTVPDRGEEYQNVYVQVAQ